MNGKDVFRGLQYVAPEFIEEAEFRAFQALPAELPKKVKKNSRKPLLIAALIAVAMLLAGCAVAYALSLPNLQMGLQIERVQAINERTRHREGMIKVTQPILTLAGQDGSLSHQAAKEWYDFKQSYDPNGTKRALLQNKGEIPEFPAEYDAYDLYTQEMKDKVDEIIQKYHLKLMGKSVDFRTAKLLCKAVGVESVLAPNSDATVRLTTGTCSDSGNLNLSFELFVPGENGEDDRTAIGTLIYRQKDVFTDDVAVIGTGIVFGEPQNIKEWNYKTAQGDNVLIVRTMDDWRAWIFCDRKDALVSLVVEGVYDTTFSTDGEGHITADTAEISDRELERMADAVDFSIKPKLKKNYEELTTIQTSATQDGFTMVFKSAVTDGKYAYITLGVTVPEGVMTFDWKKEPMRLGPGNAFYTVMAPADGTKLKNGLLCHTETRDDGDGNENTFDFVVEADVGLVEDFTCERTWNLLFDGIVDKTLDLKTHKPKTTDLTKAAWSFDFSFAGSDTRELQLIREPVTIKAGTLKEPDKGKNVSITSFALRSLSATICYVESGFLEGPNLTGPSNDSIYVVMKDGSKVVLRDDGGASGLDGVLKADSPIDLDKIDYVCFTDGTKLIP